MSRCSKSKVVTIDIFFKKMWLVRCYKITFRKCKPCCRKAPRATTLRSSQWCQSGSRRQFSVLLLKKQGF